MPKAYLFCNEIEIKLEHESIGDLSSTISHKGYDTLLPTNYF